MKLFLQSIFIFLLSNNLFSQTAGNALDFDGANDNVSANLPTILGDLTATDFTMEAWVRPQGAVFSRIIYAQGSTTNFATMSTGGTNNIYFYVVEAGTTYSIATTNTLPINTWTHVAVRWTTATNATEVFFNGVLQAGAAGGSSSTGSLNNLSIGTRPGGAQYFPGVIDEVRIWSEARSNCKIQANYTRTMIGNETNLITYYNFNQGVAATNNTGIINLPDLAGVNNGTLNNFGLTAASSNWITSGAIINAIGEVPSITSNISASSCTSVPYSFNSQLLTSTGVYRDTLTATSGCDSIIILNFTSLTPTASSSSITSCGSYTWAQTAQLYATSGAYRDTIVNVAGCDSVITLNLVINQSTAGTDTKIACNSYSWIDGNTYTSNNTTATFNIVGGAANGCDTLVTLNLTINNSATGTDIKTACTSYTWIDGNIYTSNNTTATFNIVGGAANGCDSLVTLNLTISTIDLTVSTTSNTLTANQIGASYQWIDCSNGIIPSATLQSYTATVNGDYAVIVTNGACSDTSACASVSTVGINATADAANITIYPNPASDFVIIESAAAIKTIQVMDVNGKIVYKQNNTSNKTKMNTTTLTTGVYMIQLLDESNQLLKTLPMVINK